MTGRGRIWTARAAVATFLLLWIAPGLLPGRRLTAEAYLAVHAIWRAAPVPSLPLPVIPDQSCFLVDTPGIVHAHHAWERGMAPTALPAGGGLPYLANPQLAPGAIWHAPLIVSGNLWAHSFSLALRLALAAALGWMLARRLGLEVEGAVIVAASCSGAGIMATQFLLTTPAALLLFPLLVYLAEQCVAKKTFLRAALYGTVSGLAALSGHPEPAFLVVLGSAMWWVAREVESSGWSTETAVSLAARSAWAASICVLISAPILLPFLVAFPASVSYKTELQPSSAQLACSALLVLFGTTFAIASLREGGRAWWKRWFLCKERWYVPASIALLALLLSAWLRPYQLTNVVAFPTGHAVSIVDRLLAPGFLMHLYPGLVLLPFVPLGWGALRPYRGAVGALLVAGLGLGWSLPPFDLLRLLPGFWTLTPTYAAALLTLPLALLAGAGLHRSQSSAAGIRTRLWIGALLAVGWHLWRPMQVPLFDRILLEPRALFIVALGILLLAGATLLPKRALVMCAGVILADLLLHAYPFVRPMPAYEFPRTPAIRALESALQDGGRFVALSDPDRPVPEIFPPNTALLYGLEDVRLVSAMRPKELMRRWESVAMPEIHPTVLLTAVPDAPLWDLMDVRAVLTLPGTQVPERFERLYGDAHLEVWKRPQSGTTEEGKPFALARGDEGIRVTTRDIGGEQAVHHPLHATAWDRWAGLAGPLLLLLGLLLILVTAMGPRITVPLKI